MLPDILGLDICRQIKQSNPQQFFVFMSSLGEENDLVVGLELGADDYIVKPFGVKIFRAKIRSLMRRIDSTRLETLTNTVQQNTPLASPIIQFKNLTIDPIAHSVAINQVNIELTHKEFEMLYWLAQHPGQVFSRDQLLEQIWKHEYDVTDRSIDALIRRLRDKLNDSATKSQFIETIRGVGYRFKSN